MLSDHAAVDLAWRRGTRNGDSAVVGWLFWYTIAMVLGFVFIMVVKPLS
ncbi:MAG: hypothetical protein ABIZ57_10630 [Candidatus Limnocylindria bacterium]